MKKNERIRKPEPIPVIVIWDRDTPAVCIARGEQQSEIKFADGRVRFIPNSHLRVKKQKPEQPVERVRMKRKPR